MKHGRRAMGHETSWKSLYTQGAPPLQGLLKKSLPGARSATKQSLSQYDQTKRDCFASLAMTPFVVFQQSLQRWDPFALRTSSCAARSVRIVLLIITFCLLTSSTFAAEQPYHPLRLIVKLGDSKATASITKSLSGTGARNVIPLFPTSNKRVQHVSFSEPYYLLTFDDETSRLEAESSLPHDPSIESVERDYKAELFADPLFRHQWGLTNSGQEYYGINRVAGFYNDTLVLKTGKPGADLGWSNAQTSPTDRHRTLLAIIDTGVDYEHPDLRANIWVNSDEIPNNGKDDDFNGFADDVNGFDFSGNGFAIIDIAGDPDPMDQVGHGSHVAGIAAAVGGNGIGVEGVAKNVSVMCVKIFPNAYSSVIAQGIIYAVENGAEVINASWGSPYYSSVIADAAKFADNNGVLFVAASGNSGNSTPFYPATFDYVITVGASNSLDQVTSFSTFGDWIDLVAPGEDILSLRADTFDLYAPNGEPHVRIIDSLYYLADGTSMAAPHVVGAAAFIKSVAPGIPLDSLKHLLLATADDFVDPYGDGRTLVGRDEFSGQGRLKLGRAVGLIGGDYVEIERPAFNGILSGVIPIVGSALSTTGMSYSLEVKPASAGEWIEIASGDADVVRDTIAFWDSSPYDGRTEFRLTLDNELLYHTVVRLVNNPQVEIIFPQPGDSVFSSSRILGSASAPGFQSFELAYYADSEPKVKRLIKTSTDLLYKDQLAEWIVGPLTPGTGRLVLTLFTANDSYQAAIPIVLASLLADGYPLAATVQPHLAANLGNVDDDPQEEIVIGSQQYIIVDHYDEGRLDSLSPSAATSYFSAVALHDFDNDGKQEIIAVTDSGVVVCRGDGTLYPGWPKRITTGYMYNSFATPLVTDLDNDGQMEILVINLSGEIFCWRNNGESYFHVADGLFARLDRRGLYDIEGGAFIPYLFAYDFNRDGFQDVGTLFSAVAEQAGLFLLSGKNGQALYPDKGMKVRSSQDIFGGLLADFDADGVPEIAYTYWSGGTQWLMTFVICEADGTPLPGWPKVMSDKSQWLSPYPAAADLDGDSIPELIAVMSALDGGEVYVWKGDGSPFRPRTPTDNSGLLAGVETSLSSPIVLDVDNDGEYEIVSRGGALFFGKYERLYAFNLDGTVVDRWPLFTYTDPIRVTYTPYTPLAGDFDGDGFLDLFMGTTDGRIYAWNLPTVATEKSILWGNFLYDSRRTGILPSTKQRDSTVTPPPIPQNYALQQNFPNPFNGGTNIDVAIPVEGTVTLEVVNILGQKIRELHHGYLKIGSYRFFWDGRDDSGEGASSGVYFYRLRTGTYNETRKMLFLK